MEDLIATLVLAREKAETLEEVDVADKISTRVTKLRRAQRIAEKEAAKPKK